MTFAVAIGAYAGGRGTTTEGQSVRRDAVLGAVEAPTEHHIEFLTAV